MTDWITTTIEPWLLRGACDLERTEHGLLPHRLPGWARAQFPDERAHLVEAMPTGVRLAFRTRATAVELDVLATTAVYGEARPGVYELFVDGRLAAHTSVSGGNRVLFDPTTGAVDFRPGSVGTARFDGLSRGDKQVEIWLPHSDRVELVALRTDAPVTAAAADKRPVWVHHGSSISHGANAERPTGTWPAVAAARGGVDLINLSLRGNSLLDPFMARTIRDTPADLISLKIGINIVNCDLMRLRAFAPAVHGFLDTIRETHATTPLLVVSPILCPAFEDTPGPGVPDVGTGRLLFRAIGNPADVASGTLTLTVVRKELSDIVSRRAATDPNLHYLDGLTLYGESDHAELPLPDALHPDSAIHQRMGERFADRVFASGGPFAPAVAVDSRRAG
ncbi:lipase [Nocardia terpenica]|uniref:GDSL-type esterase/lipase family protein n=1 Tax=Nocardia terpenica TaxID=455432 RepID=UPI0018930EE6|nr:GDSL-type esterase/lipase family protein [Nocardia terpenica]MBF6059187.1 lipase [Nocardia terpenica]MBF6103274.1 lipase [Nocardia terpenica]MBF6110537.1 lipase [Nocardia terpenica]MBF6116668.1 lipase [Nocardia terpenica]